MKNLRKDPISGIDEDEAAKNSRFVSIVAVLFLIFLLII